MSDGCACRGRAQVLGTEPRSEPPARRGRSSWPCATSTRNGSALVGRRYPAVCRTRDVDDVISADDIEAVLIATPVSTHHPLGMAALPGKHVFVEKPVMSALEAVELAALASSLGLVLMPGHTFSTARRWWRSTISSPPVSLAACSSPRVASTWAFPVRRQRRLGSGAARFLDPALLAGRDLTHVNATRGRVSGAGRMWRSSTSSTHPGRSRTSSSWLAPSKLRRTTIVGSEKMVVYDDTSNEPVRVFDLHTRQPERPSASSGCRTAPATSCPPYRRGRATFRSS